MTRAAGTGSGELTVGIVGNVASGLTTGVVSHPLNRKPVTSKRFLKGVLTTEKTEIPIRRQQLSNNIGISIRNITASHSPDSPRGSGRRQESKT